ncbi:glycosyltransferase [Vibrio parahaemolyticus]|uniref:glycosyltransferase n=1 Tax=Vibrio parahaemolyticus TaxID=670 RepID=UPI001F46752C|nr:glycosyltransferase [Vibrio parahaemolyticus]MCG0013173.1 glycosyltransferase [Vibrio parahaemolyticus]MDL1999104.1 glycosyltransferase [Vibrio parahaemolyticus]
MNRICVFNTLYAPNRKGGAEKSVQLVCEQLSCKGYKVDVVSIWDKVSPTYENINGVDSYKWKPYNVYSVHNYSQNETGLLIKFVWQILDFFNLFMLFKSICFFSKKKPDIVWTNNLSGFSLSIWVAAFIMRIPVCHTARDYYLLSNNVQLYKEEILKPKHNLVSKLKISLFHFLSKWLSSFVGISDFMLSLHLPYSRSKRHARIYNSVDYADAIIKNNRTLKNNYVYGYMGQMNKAKGVELLIKHFLENSNSSLILLAGNDEQNYGDKFLDSRVQFVGFQSPSDFFSNIDCLIVPSIWNEPFGRIVVEAIANELPVLCSCSGGLLELSTVFESVRQIDFSREYDYDSTEMIFCEKDKEMLNVMFSSDHIANEYIDIFYGLVN